MTAETETERVEHRADVASYPHLTPLPSGRWRITRQMRVESTRVGLITIPEGYATDLASVPRIPFAYWQTGGKARIPAIVHDWLYERGRADDGAVTRKEADQVFLDLMRSERDPGSAWRRWLMYVGVRVGGRLGWNRYRKDQGIS